MAAPALAVPRAAPKEPLRDLSARLAIHTCSQDELVVAMIGMYQADMNERLLAASSEYFAACDEPPSANVKHMMNLARARLAR